MTISQLREEVRKAARNHANGSTKVLNALYKEMGKKNYLFNLNKFKDSVNKSALNTKEKRLLISKAEKVKVKI